MDINELTIDQNLLERINPVFNTAKMTLSSSQPPVTGMRSVYRKSSG